MDCTDIIIGMARQNYSKVFDAYTRDRSTPQADSFFGGKESLTGAIAFESSDGWTTLAFERSLKATEPSDHTINDELTHVIWSFGQDETSYSHKPNSGLENGNAMIPDFYRNDEVKHHGIPISNPPGRTVTCI